MTSCPHYPSPSTTSHGSECFLCAWERTHPTPPVKIIATDRAYNIIPVPRGWSVEQSWEAISRGDLLTDPSPHWASVYVEDGRFISVLETDEQA